MANTLIKRLKANVNTFKQVIYVRLIKRRIVNNFHKLYHSNPQQTWLNTFYMDIRIAKNPLDLWVYQEIIFKLKPDVIIECGTVSGGGALFMAHMLDILNNGKVISIDLEDREGKPQHKRIRYLLGSSTSEDIVALVSSLIDSNEKVMVILDSDHHKKHVLNELRTYSRFVTEGSYLIVEDTNMNGHPVLPKFGPGPMEAVEQFLHENVDFAVDKTQEKFYLTFNPNGYLIKVR
jgi:cephalosporin hydroxylase